MNSRGLLLIILAFLSSPMPSFAADPAEGAKAAQEQPKEAPAQKEATPKAAEETKEAESAAKQENANDSSKQAEVAAPAPAAENVHLVGNAAAGKEKTQTCVSCHGPDGNSTVPNWPKIAGQYEDYLVKELKDFRAGEKGPRFEASMYAMVANLSDQDIADLASFYASQTQTMGKAQNAYVALGQKIYRGGNVQTGVTACLACHGPEGLGNEAAKFPKLAGQHAVYIENQLIAFKEGKRTNSPNGMMESISHRMSNEEIKAVSSYIEGLR